MSEDRAVLWTVLSVELMVCSEILVDYRGAYGLALATSETGRM